MIVQVHGLELFGRHGVNDDERRDGQAFIFDIWLEINQPREDAIDATVDYRPGRDIVKSVNEAKSYGRSRRSPPRLPTRSTPSCPSGKCASASASLGSRGRNGPALLANG